MIKLIQQFLKENNLHETLETLTRESNISMNTLENFDEFVSDIVSGKWDKVINAVKSIKLPSKKLILLYEHVNDSDCRFSLKCWISKRNKWLEVF